MENISPHLESELRRLANGPSSGEKPGGIGTVRFVIRCPIGTDEVLAKAKSVLKAVDDAILMGWPTNEKVAPKLPEWFTERCAAPITQEEAERQLAWWKSLPPEEQARIENETVWSLENWLYWMEPSNRQWFWWDAIESGNRQWFLCDAEVEAWPFPWGALRWLFRAAGASAVEAEE